MRLPWRFPRRSTTLSGGGSASGPAPTAGASNGSEPGPAASTGAWSELPPIQRTLGAMPLVAPPAPFIGALPGARLLPPIVKPLGHDVSPLAPAGLVVAHPGAAAASHASATLPPVQRRARVARSVAADVTAFASTAAEPDPAPVPSTAPLTPSGAPRHLAVVADAAVSLPDRPLTRAPSAAALAMPGSGLARSVQRAVDTTSTPAAASGMRRAPLDLGTGSRPTVSRLPATAGQASAISPASPRPVAEAGAQRAGLGAPLPTIPTAQRLPALPALAGRPVQRSAAAAAPSSTDAHGRVPAGPMLQREVAVRHAGPDPRLAMLPVARSAAITARAVAAPPKAASAGIPFRPVLGSGIQLGVTVQRDTDDDDDETLEPAFALPTAGGGRGSASPESDGDGAPLPMAVGAGSVPLQRAPARAGSSDAWPTPVTHWPGTSASATENGSSRPSSPTSIASRTVGRSAAGSATPSLPALSPRSGPTAAIQRSVAASAWPSSGSLPLARIQVVERADAGRPAEPAALMTHSITAQRAPTTSQSSQPLFAPTATPVVQRVEGLAPDPQPAPAERSEGELDELARSLFGRIRGHLRSELLHEREARGLTFDSF